MNAPVSAPAAPPAPDRAALPEPLPPEVFRNRRERLSERIGDAVVILSAAPELFRSRDTEVRYRQDSDFYYLTGFPEPEAVAVLAPHDEERPYTLFVRPRDPEREAWHGSRAGVEGAQARFGADAAFPIAELDAHLRDLVRPASRIFCNLGVSASMDRRVLELLTQARGARPRTGTGPTAVVDLESVTAPMRRTKEPVEIERIRTAAAIAVEAHRAAMAAARPGMGEWQLEALVESTFRTLGAEGPSFPTIVGSGPNGTVLHHVANDRLIRDGDLVLVDAGAAWGMYCSDITRTFPVSGRFSREQEAVYRVVLAAEDAAIAAVRPGASVADVHDAAVRALVQGLVDLGVLQGDVDALIEEGAYKRFYLHQTSHWLGLDVHDAGLYRENGDSTPFEPGMVLTVEPGLYFGPDAPVPDAFRSIGVRIEDDVLVTQAGHEVLTRGVPADPREVEALVGTA